ncbi:translation initiation factor IF-3 [Candidatus Uhrbacteria bacterium RIFCSPLOWO2_01_FULL_47_24]|uniref:Translation initiation factor IF-3 n=1 Tax=Candidatus Uhrbacteria bacterium RIFCSPLOWO2_01_FULL_47_24 TaxID=1802401 RepID=A0A1F7UPD3_9BACT|nr:MAG: translation initiation factor IF-3 [Candidatus Uhrbacteria bacterium RIFCSPHIGHO2_01_FULL_47_11]OGL68069.1 MAG: translation initiation factor IF-3 [Candidatus Uhrbacteria bacterium RIFCSPHIGHO2_02_FULL_46_47]OGL75443.1 MAG: translation initiation factor IF-3 [Candidatus Uhrbacteria bacterium RIFCSPHIGHO2_12_FULL_47_11]OGL80160.1 MAG: translation initiation factor IF-3 [Candidatus Uhrbacteria bacterium RIFCSPLOWO2_01_FULL_47_24]OGL84946.1 MAG: translation initiation factor IF-3 [Candidat
MRISRHRPKPVQATLVRYNEWIRVPQVRVIDEHGEHLDVMDTSKALALARERGMDLVELNPGANPPVAKIIGYGQFKYQKEKEIRKQKVHAKTVEVKGIRLSLRIGEHDLQVRRDQAERFMSEGNRVRVEIILKGREREHADLARKILENFVASLPNIRIDQPFERQGGILSMVVAKK